MIVLTYHLLFLVWLLRYSNCSLKRSSLVPRNSSHGPQIFSSLQSVSKDKTGDPPTVRPPAPAACFFVLAPDGTCCQLTAMRHLALASTAKHFSDFIQHFSLKAQKKNKARIFLETENLDCWPFFALLYLACTF